MYDKILVPLDGSELAEITLGYAEELAGRMHSAITLVCVLTADNIKSLYMYECYLKGMAGQIKTAVEKSASGKESGEIEVDYKILRGDAAEEIIDYADKAKIDLIIMSTKGHSGITRWALGNVANKVLRATHKQVLLIRARGAKYDVAAVKMTKVLVPLDGSRVSESIIRHITSLATQLELKVTLFHMWARDIKPPVGSPKQSGPAGKREISYIKGVEERLNRGGVDVESVFKEVWAGEEAEEIVKLEEEGGYSLVAMATHGRSGVGHWIFGSNAEKVLAGGSMPLLLFRPVKRRTRSG